MLSDKIKRIIASQKETQTAKAIELSIHINNVVMFGTEGANRLAAMRNARLVSSTLND